MICREPMHKNINKCIRQIRSKVTVGTKSNLKIHMHVSLNYCNNIKNGVDCTSIQLYFTFFKNESDNTDYNLKLNIWLLKSKNISFNY